ncbi:MAG: GNAT family N-acetyltransferase [Planctomycetota bacterium]
MIRENLDGVPECPVPSGYSIRSYRSGDENIWLRIQSLADKYNKITPDLFQEEFGTDTRVLSERQYFLYDGDNNAIGTASAWFGNHNGPSLGRIHWVAIIPRYQSKGLAEPLLATVCKRLKCLGHRETFLTTQTCRVPAINLYAKFGFVPVVESNADRKIWNELAKHVKYPLPF